MYTQHIYTQRRQNENMEIFSEEFNETNICVSWHFSIEDGVHDALALFASSLQPELNI